MSKQLLNIAMLNGATPSQLRKGGTASDGSGSGSGSGIKWTGHADVEGLKAIGWTDGDIAYYQANGVNWNEEDDQFHKVPEDNIALSGVLTADNIQEYKDRIVYLPKINTSSSTSLSGMFNNCFALVTIPQLDTSNVTDMSCMFEFCYSLTSIPQLNTSNVTDMSFMFDGCSAFKSIPQLDTSNVTNMSCMFSNCQSLVTIPQLDTSNVTDMSSMFGGCYSLTSIPQLNTSNVTDMSFMFNSCSAFTTIPQLDTSNVTNMERMLIWCFAIQTVNIENIKSSIDISSTSLLKKDSLLYIINNEAATQEVHIGLNWYCYDKYAADADVADALTNHPNISLIFVSNEG